MSDVALYGSMRYKIKMRLFLVTSIIFLGLSVNGMAAERPCGKSGSTFKERNLAKLISEVKIATSKGDVPEMKRLVACDFMLVEPDSDVGGFRRGESLVPSLATTLKGVVFTTSTENYGTQVNLDSDQPKRRFTLIFRRDDPSGWYWAGFSSYDHDLLNGLLKGSYQLRSKD